jgi:hypothetical protein
MALNIEVSEMERLAHRAAELRGTSVAEALLAAPERDVAILEEESKARLRRRARQ